MRANVCGFASTITQLERSLLNLHSITLHSRYEVLDEPVELLKASRGRSVTMKQVQNKSKDPVQQLRAWQWKPWQRVTSVSRSASARSTCRSALRATASSASVGQACTSAHVTTYFSPM